MTINRPDESTVGLFGGVLCGTIKNIKLVNANVTGKDYVGGIVGGISKRYDLYSGKVTESGGRIENCTLDGGTISGNSKVGGLVGLNLGQYVGNNLITGNFNVNGSSDFGLLAGTSSVVYNYYGAGGDITISGNLSENYTHDLETLNSKDGATEVFKLNLPENVNGDNEVKILDEIFHKAGIITLTPKRGYVFSGTLPDFVTVDENGMYKVNLDKDFTIENLSITFDTNKNNHYVLADVPNTLADETNTENYPDLIQVYVVVSTEEVIGDGVHEIDGVTYVEEGSTVTINGKSYTITEDIDFVYLKTNYINSTATTLFFRKKIWRFMIRR